jgi:hypothetical protein
MKITGSQSPYRNCTSFPQPSRRWSSHQPPGYLQRVSIMTSSVVTYVLTRDSAGKNNFGLQFITQDLVPGSFVLQAVVTPATSLLGSVLGTVSQVSKNLNLFYSVNATAGGNSAYAGLNIGSELNRFFGAVPVVVNTVSETVQSEFFDIS